MKPNTELDPFEAGFDPDDDFGLLAEPARPSMPSAAPAMFDLPSAPVEAAPAANPVGELQSGLEASLGTSGVPRIAIHVFCEREESAAAATRVMSKTP